MATVRPAISLLVVLALAGSADGQKKAPAAPATQPAKINVTPAKVVTKTFDPKNPPAEMPRLNREEAAVTQSQFACGVQVEIEINQAPGENPIATVVGVNATLQLDVTIWLPTNVSAKIRRHEDGHRDISELFYAKGKTTADAIAKKLIGKRIIVPGVKPEQTTPIIQRLANEFCETYLGQIELPSQAVQERYDQLTDHGRNKLGEAEAIKQALAERE